MISVIIPTYRNPKYLDLCLKSCIDQQVNKNEIIVAVDGFYDESKDVLEKYKNDIKVLDLGHNQGMQQALNLGVINANNEKIFIVNDDNVFCSEWDTVIEEELTEKNALTINQIEPTGPGFYNFPVKDCGKNTDEFDYDFYINYEKNQKKDKLTDDGGIFPFAMYKKDYMIVGGFDVMYQSPFICDWDFFLKLDLNGIKFTRTHKANLYHFGSTATKNRGGDEDEIKFKKSEMPAAQLFAYKWGIPPALFENLSHNPKNGQIIKGIKYE